MKPDHEPAPTAVTPAATTDISASDGAPSTPPLDQLFDPSRVTVEHIKRWHWLAPEKRVVRHGEQRWVLMRSWWPWQMARLHRVVTALQEAGASQQGVVARTRHCADVWRCRGAVLALQYVPGVPLNQTRMQSWHAQGFGRAVALWHQISARMAGAVMPAWPWAPLRNDCGDGAWKAAWEASRQTPELTPAERAQLQSFLTACRPALQRRQQFQLTHGDAHARNVVVDEATASVHLIDPELAAFDIGGFEVAYVLHEVLRGGRRIQREAWLQGYLAHCGPDLSADWEQNGAAFLVVHHLRRAVRRRALMHRRERWGIPFDRERFEITRRQHLRHAVALAELWQSGIREPLAMLAALEPSIPPKRDRNFR